MDVCLSILYLCLCLVFVTILIVHDAGKGKGDRGGRKEGGRHGTVG